MEKRDIPEEITITPVIRDIEKLINKGVSLIKGIFRSIGSTITAIVLSTFRNFKILAALMIITCSVGTFYHYNKEKTYISSIILKPYYKSKRQLYSDVDYFNALISNGEYDILSKTLKISKEEATRIDQFTISTDATYAEKIMSINELQNLSDSSLQYTNHIIDIDLLIEEGIEISNRFKIEIITYDRHIFRKLEAPLIEYFERVEEIQMKRNREIKILNFRKDILNAEIQRLDTFKTIINKSMILSASSGATSSNTTVNLSNPEENESWNPGEVYDRYLRYMNEVSIIDNRLTEIFKCYEIEQHLNHIGEINDWGIVKLLAFSIIVSLVIFYSLLASLSVSKRVKKLNTQKK